MKTVRIAASLPVAAFIALILVRPAACEERLRYLLDWTPQAEHGGYFQAVAKGFYKKRGLDVVLMAGGPDVNNPRIIASGAVDLGQVQDNMAAYAMIIAGAPVRAVMASFQKNPQILVTHPRDDINSLADMKGKPIMISDTSVSTYWIWMKSTFGFSDSQIRKFNNNYAPFLIDKSAIAQAYVTSSPLLIEREGVAPKIFLLSDYGFKSYGSIVVVPQTLIDSKPGIVQAFVDATIEGWASYLFDDPAPAWALIKQANPDATDDINAYALQKLKDYEIVTSQAAGAAGIGIMSPMRWKATFDEMSAAGIYPASMDYSRVFTLQFLTARNRP